MRTQSFLGSRHIKPSVSGSYFVTGTIHTGGVLRYHNFQNPINPTVQNLAPEDVENLIQNWAVDIGPANGYPSDYDSHNGWGRINAGLTMQMINAPEYRVWHSGNPSSTSVSTASPTGFILEEQAYGLPAGTYSGANVQVTHTYNVSFPENIDIMAGWGRRTSVLGYLPLVTNSQVYNTPFATWSISISGNTATVTSITNCIQISDSFWLPAHPNQLKTPFSLHLRDLNYASTVEKFDDTELELVAYPNPVRGILNLELNHPADVNMQVSLLNGLGQPVYRGSWNSGSRNFTIDSSKLPAGLYCLLVKFGNRNLVKTIIVD